MTCVVILQWLRDEIKTRCGAGTRGCMLGCWASANLPHGVVTSVDVGCHSHTGRAQRPAIPWRSGDPLKPMGFAISDEDQ